MIALACQALSALQRNSEQQFEKCGSVAGFGCVPVNRFMDSAVANKVRRGSLQCLYCYNLGKKMSGHAG